VDQLQASQLVNAFNARYARCIDQDQLEAWPEFFVEDCLYSISSRENVKARYEAGIIYCDSKGMLADRVSALREANVYEPQHYLHLVGCCIVDVCDDARIVSETPFTVYRTMAATGESCVFATGWYSDEFRVAGSELRLHRRVVVCDSGLVDTMLAIPL
jgi:3-phenylpropionate/cinnamic acid dioxygenase small subunit